LVWSLNFHKYIHADNVNPDLFELVASDTALSTLLDVLEDLKLQPDDHEGAKV
jgi:hypothetical protein